MTFATRLPNPKFLFPNLLLLLSKLLHQNILQGRLTNFLQFVAYALMRLRDLHHAGKINRRTDDDEVNI